MNIMCCTVLSLTVYSRGDLGPHGPRSRGCVVCGVLCICACCELWATDYERSLEQLLVTLQAASSASVVGTVSLYVAVTSNRMITKSPLELLFSIAYRERDRKKGSKFGNNSRFFSRSFNTRNSD